MKSVFTKISAIFLTLLVISSTTSFAIDKHYCGDTLVDTSFFAKATSCGMDSNELPKDSCSFKKKDCCSDIQILIEGQDDLKGSLDDFQFYNNYFIISVFNFNANPFEGYSEKVINYKKYIPPLVVKEIYKLDETYLI